MNQPLIRYFKGVKFEHLALDTSLFGFKVAKILNSRLSLEKLRLILDKLKAENVHLVYWPAASTDKKSQSAAKKLQGFLSSKQVTYLAALRQIALPKTTFGVVAYRAKTPTLVMKKLSIQIGVRSRFGTDPQLPKRLMHKLYSAWIKNSVNGTVADKVLVTRHKNTVVGMIILGTKGRCGDIKLLAVDESYRGKGIGAKLIGAAQNYFVNQGYTKLRVVTQLTNTPACCLYEKCGLRCWQIINFYHFWL